MLLWLTCNGFHDPAYVLHVSRQFKIGVAAREAKRQCRPQYRPGGDHGNGMRRHNATYTVRNMRMLLASPVENLRTPDEQRAE